MPGNFLASLFSRQPNIGADNFLQRLAMMLDQRSPYGMREDGSGKGPGLMGAVPNQGGESTELSIGVDPQPPYRGNVTENGYSYNSIPSMVPTLTPDEMQWLLGGNPPTDQIMQKAVEFARLRQSQGLSPFRGWGENNQYALPRGASR